MLSGVSSNVLQLLRLLEVRVAFLWLLILFTLGVPVSYHRKPQNCSANNSMLQLMGWLYKEILL